MVVCNQRRSYLLRSAKEHNQTSYERAHYFQNAHVILKDVSREREIPKELTQRISLSDNYVSVYNKLHDAKYEDYLPDRYGRSWRTSNPMLKLLHEKYIKDPVRPMKYGVTTYGTTYQRPRLVFEPVSLRQTNPAADATIPSTSFDKDFFVPLNEPGYGKHQDPYVSTTHLTHTDFSVDQLKGVARKDIITFWDTIAKGSGLNPEVVPEIGPYYPRCKGERNLLFLSRHCKSLPGTRKSTYRNDYDPRSTNLRQRVDSAPFPALFKLSRKEIFATPAMYCTEQCHVGTGWPIRAAVDVGAA